jgi:hypothetical protein
MIDRTSPLLKLPLELQDIIYKEVLLQPAQAPHLLRVCREIYAKAHQFLFQRSLSFRSQSALQRWIRQAPQGYLKYVGEIDFKLQDADLTPLLASASSSLVAPMSSASPLHTWDVYERELRNLRHAFEELPNVKKFTFQALSGRQSHLYHAYLDKVLEMMGTVYPGLQELRLDGNMHHQSLAFLRTFKELKAFSFDGFSASEAAQTAEILSNLQLTNISLVSQHALLTPTYYQHSGFTSKLQSFNGSVLRTLNQLASFSVTERYSATSSALFFTSEILSSLHDHKTLSSLSIILSHTPEPNTLEALEEFLDNSSSIQKLELDWSELDPDILENYALLPDSLQCLWIRATNLTSAFDILWHVFNSRDSGDVPSLRRVVLGRHALEDATASDTYNGSASTIVQPVENNDLGVEIRGQQVSFHQHIFMTPSLPRMCYWSLVHACTVRFANAAWPRLIPPDTTPMKQILQESRVG